MCLYLSDQLYLTNRPAESQASVASTQIAQPTNGIFLNHMHEI